MKIMFFIAFLGAVSAFGQDDGSMMAAQQAAQTSLQASQQAIQDMQRTSQQAQQDMQQAMDFALSSGYLAPIIGSAMPPTFSVRPGKVARGTLVRINSRTHYAAIFYTTDGWTPTKSSIRYTGPIEIMADTHLRAITFGPNLLHSSVALADYTVDAPATMSVPQPVQTVGGVLPKSTSLRLKINSQAGSHTAQVGDKISLLLDQDIKVNDTVVAPKGTQVDGIITIADPAEKRDQPGDLVFEVHALTADGKTIPLTGGQTLEGERGRKPTEAVIAPGMVVTVYVSADTPLGTPARDAAKQTGR